MNKKQPDQINANRYADNNGTQKYNKKRLFFKLSEVFILNRLSESFSEPTIIHNY